MFKQHGHYFLSISFEWEDIFRILEVPESVRANLVIDERYAYKSTNANGPEGLGINSVSALFEYYIMPNVLRNGRYSYSAIYDQQLKRFFTSPNISYGPVLRHSKNEDSHLICFFKSDMPSETEELGNAGFAISFSHDRKWRTILFTFDSQFLSLTDAHSQWGERIPFDAYEILNAIELSNAMSDDVINKVSVDPKKIRINTNVQSQDDAQTGPFDLTLYNFLKK